MGQLIQLLGYPRSGSTWVAEMLSLAAGPFVSEPFNMFQVGLGEHFTTKWLRGLDPPEGMEFPYREIQERIKEKNMITGKFTEDENLHLTLKFLGEVEKEKIEKVKKRLKRVMMPCFDASLGDVGVFSDRFLKIIWVKLEGKGVWELQKKVDDMMKDLFLEEQRFMSHITIARIKKVTNKTDFLSYLKNIKTKNIKFEVKEFFLKKSELMPEGPIYEDLERYKLK